MTQLAWHGTRNGDHHFGKDYAEAQLRAAGFDRKSNEAQPRFNGGVAASREVRLQKGDCLYRFCGSAAKTLQNQFTGEWWFDEDMCVLLWSLSDGRADNSFREAARTMFAVLPEWSDMNFCVKGKLRYDFWAIRGTTARARSKGVTLINRHGREARQLYVPGKLHLDDFVDAKRIALTRQVY